MSLPSVTEVKALTVEAETGGLKYLTSKLTREAEEAAVEFLIKNAAVKSLNFVDTFHIYSSLGKRLEALGYTVSLYQVQDGVYRTRIEW